MNDDPGQERSRDGPATVLVSDRQDIPLDAEALSALAQRILESEGRHAVELSLSFVSSEEMADLNERYMGEDGPTDVLSFPMGEDGLLGDVVVCPELATADGSDRGSGLRLLVAHGVLHLLGYDHEEDEERREMWERQERYSRVRA